MLGTYSIEKVTQSYKLHHHIIYSRSLTSCWQSVGKLFLIFILWKVMAKYYNSCIRFLVQYAELIFVYVYIRVI